MRYPIAWIREQFPALDGSVVYLDNAAGSQVPRHVVELVRRALVEWNANRDAPHRPSEAITRVREEVRSRAAEFLGAAASRNVVFGPNATTLVVLLADAWRRRLRPGDEVVVTGLDHHANVDPWLRLEERGVTVRRWEPRGPETTLALDDLRSVLTERTKVLAVTAASNALGTLVDVRAAADVAHDAGAHVMVDAVHLAPHVLPDADALGADMLVYSPYKAFGPHLGVLFLRDPLLDELPHHGLSFMTPGDAGTWETGTQNHEGLAGLGGTFDYLDELGAVLGAPERGRPAWTRVYEAVARHEEALGSRLLDGLAGLGIETYGRPTPRGRTPTVAFSVDGLPARTVAEHLATRGVAASDGHFYAHHLVMRTLGLAARGGAVRVSAVHYTSEEDVDAALGALAELRRSGRAVDAR